MAVRAEDCCVGSELPGGPVEVTGDEEAGQALECNVLYRIAPVSPPGMLDGTQGAFRGQGGELGSDQDVLPDILCPVFPGPLSGTRPV